MNKKHFSLVGILAFSLSTFGWAKPPSTGPNAPITAEEQAAILNKIRPRLEALGGSSDSKVVVERAKLTYFIGQYSSKDEDKLNSFRQGLVALEPAAAEGKDPDAVLIWAANAGGVASIERNLDALRLMDKIEKRLLTLSEKFPSHESGAAYRALAAIYFNAPSLISVGSSKKAAQYATKAYSLDPNSPANMLMMARVEADQGNKTRAAELYREVLQRAKADLYPLDYAAWHNEAVTGLDDAGALNS
ncbi:MAG: hypothetical protein FJ146_14030 [Deltaproteobacteria bacterium]|nr:hypothetical protein [Deltaproteobacteria bacterium]